MEISDPTITYQTGKCGHPEADRIAYGFEQKQQSPTYSETFNSNMYS
jgi:hypothetical protein